MIVRPSTTPHVAHLWLSGWSLMLISTDALYPNQPMPSMRRIKVRNSTKAQEPDVLMSVTAAAPSQSSSL